MGVPLVPPLRVLLRSTLNIRGSYYVATPYGATPKGVAPLNGGTPLGYPLILGDLEVLS